MVEFCHVWAEFHDLIHLLHTYGLSILNAANIPITMELCQFLRMCNILH